MHPDPALPCDLRDLPHAEHLVVWSLRAYAAGRIDCPIVARAWRDACGPLGDPARAAFTVFGQQLAVQGRRPVILGRAGLVTLTRDEQLLLAIFAAAQDGDTARCEARLTWLLGRPAGPPFATCAEVVAHALAAHGHRMRRPPEALAPRPAREVRRPKAVGA
jgi:hypothetical protein